MIILAVVSKFGALFASIPNPVVGGVFVVMFGMVTAVGLSNLQFCDMNSPRNIFIVGFSIIFGLAFPNWLRTGNNSSVIKTTVTELDQIIVVLLSTNIAVGGLVALILDNIIPGTLEERGMHVWHEQSKKIASASKEYRQEVRKSYNLPCGLTKYFHKCGCTNYMPFCPPRYDDTEAETEETIDPETGKEVLSTHL